MEQFEETLLWSRTLAKGNESERTEAARERLRNAFLGFRRRAAVLANEIPQNLRTLTVHDVTHLDALWEVADTIIGDDFDINPAEAFVLGGAILLHDLGMSLSSYNAGINDLRIHPSWPDVIYNFLHKELNRAPTNDELSNPGSLIEEQAANQLLRDLHAKHAQELAKIGFSRSKGETYYLLEDVELRDQIGGLIGEIAYSHWWPIEEVTRRFTTKIGSFIFSPKSWTIDPLKIACLLRCSDACHLDGRRASSFLMALRKPTGISELHWEFQERLLKPTVENNRFIFTTSRPFQSSEHQAWWLCFESLQMADRELRQANTALADLGRQQFLIQGIAGTDGADRLLKYIPAQGWEPIDINVRVSDVPSLVKKLGGSSLYGQNPIVPLRELIQNGCDAVRARRIFESRPNSWGEVTISLRNMDGSEVITVSDCGTGMSREVLTGPLLDFGESYWNSRLAQDELPGLARKGFTATGGFGIGFYSAFMWGDDVKVITRSRNSSPSETLVLHFQQGLENRPILRGAEAAEQLIEPGTSVSVRLDHTTTERIIEAVEEYSDFYYSTLNVELSLSELCAWLCPISDVNIVVKDLDNPQECVVNADDWKNMSANALMERIRPKQEIIENDLDTIEKRMRPVMRNGEMIARLAISSDLEASRYGGSAIVTAGILRSSSDPDNVTGVLVGRPSTASRQSATSVMNSEELRKWACEQCELIGSVTLPQSAIKIAKTLRRCGAETGSLFVAESSRGLLTFDEVSGTQWPDEVVIVNHVIHNNTRSLIDDVELLPNALSVDFSGSGDEGLPTSWHASKSSLHRWRFNHETLLGAVLEALSKSWKVPLDSLIEQIEISADERIKISWGETPNGRQFKDRYVYIIRKTP